jgi:lipopolysaccharide transport system ATP-binding protein
MAGLAIRADGLSKRYRLGETVRHDTLRDQLASLFRRGTKKREAPKEFWALRDVSFEVRRGEVLGIVGHNGAGKSTLLKILSRITSPTTGSAQLFGRFASLLEVGTGFHPELTGRDNIFLNGSILGMGRREIQAKFDEIVAFAEVEEFIDTPVKRYSSGMYVRLAFAVAAHLEPEILLVDEVLAVGDVAFQQRCLNRMNTVASEGRTVLFVSHNMAAITQLCTTAILLRKGQVEARGTPAEVTELYLRQGLGGAMSWEATQQPDTEAFFRGLRLSPLGKAGVLDLLTVNTPFRVVADFSVALRSRNLQLSVDIVDSLGEVVFASTPPDCGCELPVEPGSYIAEMKIPAEVLMPRTYGLRASLYLPGVGTLDRTPTLWFSVEESNSWVCHCPGGRAGKVALKCDWSIAHSSQPTLEGAPHGPILSEKNLAEDTL